MSGENESTETKTETETTETSAPTTDPGAEHDPARNQVEDGSLVSKGGEETQEAAEEAAAPEPLTAEQLTVPEGLEADSEALSTFVEMANEHGIPQEAAQKLVDFHADFVKQMGDEFTNQWTQTQEDWQRQVKELPEIGGENLSNSLTEIAKVVDRYGSQELRQALDVTGAGNHPEVVKFLHNVAKAVNEQPPVSGQPTSTAPTSRADRLFGNQGAN